jgi:hypothetical protein
MEALDEAARAMTLATAAEKRMVMVVVVGSGGEG